MHLLISTYGGLDFGNSKIKKQTETMTQVGTPQWMAPEVLLGDKYSEKADIYSFGVVVWELATNEIPWDEINAVQVISKVAYEHKHLQIPPSCPPSISKMITQCFHEKPAERPSFKELLHQIENITI